MTSPEPEPFQPRHLSGPWRPSTVEYAFWSGIAGVVVGFGILAAAFLMVSDAELQLVLDQARAQGQPMTLEQARSIYLAVLALTTAIVAVIAALWIMFLFFLRRGRNWARIVVTVVGVVWFLITIPSVFGGTGGSALTAVLGVLQLAAVGATVVFANLAPSTEYFRAAGRR
ncbi:hypothetical protein GCM10011581_32820 [Saccharopolyspora subtropica]|uniref:Uncharacterized protein n=1 Tax=Saccharopolyspora thermophila TaxID=89367 RepID=A0A917JYP9_9PSEU|nr:hypothetical protein [Saccharopolyspora subtropica]GGI93156.1 hypothetical protein GCM10011581_32820 [Saccharopolyspora subtropica]